MQTKHKKEFTEIVEKVQVLHRGNFTSLFDHSRSARIVVWATTDTGKRVWVRTVEGRFDSLFIEIKIAMAQEFFQKLIGREIGFHEGSGGSRGVFFAGKELIPEEFGVSYKVIKDTMWEWVENNLGEEIKRLYGKKVAKTKATREKNELRRKECVDRLDLPEDSSWFTIDQALIREENLRRRKERLG